MLRPDGREQRTKPLIVRPPEKGKRCNHRAGADPCDQLETRDSTRVRPAAEQTGAKSTIVSAAGECQKMSRGEVAVPAERLGGCGAFPAKCFDSLGNQSLSLRIRPKPCVADAEHGHLVRQGRRWGRTTVQSSASPEEGHRRNSGCQPDETPP